MPLSSFLGLSLAHCNNSSLFASACSRTMTHFCFSSLSLKFLFLLMTLSLPQPARDDVFPPLQQPWRQVLLSTMLCHCILLQRLFRLGLLTCVRSRTLLPVILCAMSFLRGALILFTLFSVNWYCTCWYFSTTTARSFCFLVNIPSPHVCFICFMNYTYIRITCILP